jgi:hypothetical protein
MPRTSQIALAVLLALAAAWILPRPIDAAPQSPQCPEGYSVQAGSCSCSGVACSYTFTATSSPLGFACGTCRWNYSWSVDCHECGDPSTSGSINMNCDPHQRGSQKLVIPCPANGSDWVTVQFTCGWCQ